MVPSLSSLCPQDAEILRGTKNNPPPPNPHEVDLKKIEKIHRKIK